MSYQATKNTQNTEKTNGTPYDLLKQEFVNNVRAKFSELTTEISERNANIQERDDYIYGDKLASTLDIPVGHDRTSVNWLRRTVEIHKNMFMGRGFQVISTYDTADTSTATDDQDKQRLEIENKKNKEFAETRMRLIQSIKTDNGGDTFWTALAENASSIGDAAIKMWYDEDEDKIELCQIESIENLYALWSKDDFREVDAYAFAYQVSKQEAISEYGASDDVKTSPLGSPMETLSATSVANQFSSQPMVTILEVTGKLEGWGSDSGKLKKVSIGKENEINALVVGDDVTRLLDDVKKLPKYYLLPNKRQRRRPWGMSDVSDAAIQINQSYIETLSDWRTVASKVNFPKFKAFGFGFDTQMPKPEPRTVEYLPLTENQDIVELQTGTSNGQDFGNQMSELKEQFVRETGISRVLFDDPSVTLNSNQALLTSMKPTSDIAEAKKQLWGPVLTDMFTDALELLAQYKPELKELISTDGDDWKLKLMWPSVMQKEDPVYQSMLLNRFNAGLMSTQSFMEAQGESKEEIDRIRDELNDPVTAGILGHSLQSLAGHTINASLGIPPWGYITPKVALRGDLAPQEVGNMAHNYQWDVGPYGSEIGPTGFAGAQANQDTLNSGFVNPDGSANYQGPQQQQPGNGAQITTTPQNQPGQQPVSQPGTGAATPISPAGAVAQTNQNAGH